MTKTRIAILSGVLVLLALAFTGIYQIGKRVFRPVAAPSSTSAPAAGGEPHPEFLYGRVTSITGTVYEGRFRTRDGEETVWTDLFNGRKAENPWAKYAAPRDKNGGGGFLGLGRDEREEELARPFMARFGDIARIESSGKDVVVTLKSGMVATLNRLDASDFDDGLHVWDMNRGFVDLDSRLIRTIELKSAPRKDANPERLHGTVHTKNEEFMGFIQWNREKMLGSENLNGEAGGESVSVPLSTIVSIARESDDAARVTLRDGREMVMSGSREVSARNRGIYVDDQRYGRVLISWGAFERVDITPGESGPDYGDFPAGGPLRGSVTTRDGHHLFGRLVYDLDESEITETLDAPANGVDYILPFGLITSIIPHQGGGQKLSGATVTLHSGQTLQLERKGDLGDGNGGVLIFVDDGEKPDYVAWTDVERIELDRPDAMYPPIQER